MRILLSNDDGVHAPGIQTLAKALREFADVQVVAPDRNPCARLPLKMVILLFKWEPRPIASILA